MKVTIDGVTYEGTEEEIRSIVENPPTRPRPQVGDCPDNDRNWDDDEDAYKVPHQRNYPWPTIQPVMPVYPYPYPPVFPDRNTTPTYPPQEIPSWPSDFPRHWDGSPIVTCYYEAN